jgi:anti-anti-sigma factor
MSELKQIELTNLETFLLARPQCRELDEEHTSDMQEKIQEAAKQSPELAIILDMSGVSFLPSLSLGALVSLMQDAKQRQQHFILVGLQPDVRQTLALCRLDKLFEIYDTVETARQKIRQST